MTDKNDDEAAYQPPHIIPAEAGGGTEFMLFLRGTPEPTRAYDLRNLNQVREDWIQRKSGKGGVLTFTGTADGSGEGAGCFAADEIIAITNFSEFHEEPRAFTLYLDSNQSPTAVGPGDDEDDSEDDDDDEGDGGFEVKPSLADFKA